MVAAFLKRLRRRQKWFRRSPWIFGAAWRVGRGRGCHYSRWLTKMCTPMKQDAFFFPQKNHFKLWIVRYVTTIVDFQTGSGNKRHAMFLNTCDCLGYFGISNKLHFGITWKGRIESCAILFMLITLLSVSSIKFSVKNEKKHTDQLPLKKNEAIESARLQLGEYLNFFSPGHQKITVFDRNFFTSWDENLQSVPMFFGHFGRWSTWPFFSIQKDGCQKVATNHHYLGVSLNGATPKTPQNEHFF